MKEIITARKLRGRIRKLNPDLEFQVKDIRINGVLRGCSGFIVDPASGNIVYVNTEGTEYQPLASQFMYRKAENLKDYTGGINRWAKRDDVATPIVEFIQQDFEKVS